MSTWGSREGADFLACVKATTQGVQRIALALETIAKVLSESVVYVRDSDRV